MKNHNDEAMASYFSSMLNDTEPAPVIVDTLVEPEPAQLNVAVLPEALRFAEPESATEPQAEKHNQQLVAPTIAPVPATPQQTWKNLDVEDQFQVLFFELSGLTFAVPLTDLGGIHHLDDSLNSLIGKPDWFSGVMTHNSSLFNIVDTAKWISTGESAKTLNYTHYILLGTTPWGLSCEKLIGTEVLSRSQIKWRESQGKRPWLAGMVKQKMCALIHAEELVKLLNSGLNIHGN